MFVFIHFVSLIEKNYLKKIELTKRERCSAVVVRHGLEQGPKFAPASTQTRGLRNVGSG